MISTLLCQEYKSERFAADIGAVIDREGIDPSVVTDPDLADPAENELRARIIKLYKGYGTAEGQYLSRFPRTLRWERCALTPDELLSVRFIDWSYWNELSGGSRLPADAALRITDGFEAFGVDNGGPLAVAEAVRAGKMLPELILATTGEPGARIVVVEGHRRLTGYALAAESLPSEIEALVGTGQDLAAWGCY